MSKRGRKGRASNELVAASCAAILAVYAAGYWRTREEARRFETQAQVRRPARTEPASPEASGSPEVPAVSSANTGAPMPVSEKTPRVAAIPAAAPASPARSAGVSEPATLAVTAAPTEPGQEEAAEVSPESAPISAVTWRDGTYTAWGLSYHGDIEARVIIHDGRIRTSEIATCATRYPCYVIDSIIQQPVERQSGDVDRVSRATESAEAYRDAVWGALQKAEAGPAVTSAESP